MTDDERELACSRCGTIVRVRDGGWIDPDLYACPPCRTGDEQAPLFRHLAGVLEETPPYDPAMAAICF